MTSVSGCTLDAMWLMSYQADITTTTVFVASL